MAFAKRRKLWILAALVILALPILFLILLYTPFARNLALGRLQASLAASGIELKVKELRADPLGGSVELRGVSVSAKAAADLPVLATAESAALNVGLSELLRGDIVVPRLRLQNLSIHYVIDSNGRDNLPQSGGGASGKSTYLIQDAEATGRFRFEDRRSAIDVQLPRWQLRASGVTADAIRSLRFETGAAGSIQAGKLAVPLDSIELNASRQGDRVEIADFRLRAGEWTGSASGRITDLDAARPQFDLQAKAALGLSQARKLFPSAEIPVDGALDLNARIRGPLAQPVVEAEVRGVELRHAQAGPIDLSLDVRHEVGGGTAAIRSLSVGALGGTLQAAGVVALQAKGASNLTARFANIRLPMVAEMAKVPIVVASRVSGNGAVSWTGFEYREATAQVTARLEPMETRPARNRIPVAGEATIHAKSGVVDATIGSLDAAGVQLTGTASMQKDGALSGSLQAKVPALRDTLDQIGRFTGAEPLALQGSATADLTLGGTLSDPAVAAAVEGADGDVTVAAHIDASRSLITLRDGALAFERKPLLTVTGELKIQPDGTPLQARLTADQLPVAILRRMVKNTLPLDGLIAGTVDVEGDARAPKAAGNITAAGLVLFEEPLGDLTAALKMEGKLVELPAITLRKPGGELTGDATYRLDTGVFQAKGDSRGFPIAKLVLPSGETVSGNVALNLRAEGTASDPRVDGEIRLRDARHGEISIAEANAILGSRGPDLTFDVSLPQQKARATGQIESRAPYRGKVEIRLDHTDLATLPIPVGANGSIAGTLRAAGDVEHWQDAAVSGRLETVRVEKNGASVAAQAPLEFELAGHTLTLQPVTLQTGASKLTLQGTLPVDDAAPPADLRLSGDATTQDLAPLLAAFGQPLPGGANGAAQWDLAVRGPFRRFTLEGTAGLKSDFANLAANLQARNGVIRIEELRGKWANGDLAGTGEVPLGLLGPPEWIAGAATGAGRLNLKWTGVDVPALLGSKDPRLTGTMSAEADVEVHGFRPQDLIAQVRLTPLNLGVAGQALALERPARIELRHGVARIQDFELTGTGGALTLKGEAGLLAPQPLNVEGSGKLDVGLLAAFFDQVEASGDAALQVRVRGTVAQPSMSGSVDLTNGEAGLSALNMRLEAIQAHLALDGDKITLTRLSGTANGGTIAGTGSLRLVNGEPQDTQLNLTAANVYLEYPRDLKTLFSSALALRQAGRQFTLQGDVQILEGSYNENINFDEFVLRRAAEVPSAAADTDAFLKRLRLNVGVRSAAPVLVNNNLAKAAISSDLRVLGTADRPTLSGRLTVEEGGVLVLNEKEYTVDRAVVQFVDDRQIKPTLDILAHTKAGGHEITLQVQGEQGALESKFTSDSLTLTESDIISLLATGRTLEGLQGSESAATREQVLSYLASRVGSTITRNIERTFGLSQVRIQPNLIAAESDPSARLTVGQDLTRALRLTYSMDLAKSNEQLWVGEWDVTRRFRLRGFKDFDNTYRFEFRHELQFAKVEPLIVQARTPIRKLGNIAFQGNFYVTEKELASRAKLRTGRTHDFFAVRKAVTRMETLYRDRGYLEARVRAERETTDTSVNLRFQIREGQPVHIAYEGWNPSGDVQKRVRTVWERGTFDTGRVMAAMAELRSALQADGFLQPTLTHRIREARPDAPKQEKQVLFEIQPGDRFDRLAMEFTGASEARVKTLRRLVEAHRPKTDIYTRPQRIATELVDYYRQQGFLDAAIEAPKVEPDLQSRTAVLRIGVREGPQFKIASIRFSGNANYPETELRGAVVLAAGQNYRPAELDQAVNALLSHYAERGYTEAEVETALQREGEGVAIDFQIREKRRARLHQVMVLGNWRTSESLILRQTGLRAGEILNSRTLSEARRGLYSTSAFSLVEIETEEVEDAPEAEQFRNLKATVRVRELAPFSLKYGGFYETERGPGVIFDLISRNWLGSARVAGVRGRYDSQLQEVRGYFSQPLLKRFPVGTTSTAFFRRELRKDFIADRTGASVVQESKFRRHFVLNYGYRMEQTHTYDRVPDPDFPFDITLRVAPLQASLTMDRRDDILDATRGSFLSQSFEYAPALLGSQLRFIRYYAQYFHYQPLTAPAEVPWSGGARRPRFVYAGAVRLGAAKGLGGQELVVSERFFAGGGNTVRGFGLDMVGPLDRRGDPTGGNALFVTNHELRFPAFSIVDGVAFVDAGNVYKLASELRPWQLRSAAGFGLRLRTPYLLFRVDYGMNLNRRTGEPAGKWFFSIGQTF